MSRLAALALAGASLLAACGSTPTSPLLSNQAPTVTTQLSPAAAALADQLERGTHGDFWNYAVHDQVVAAIWNEPDSRARLEEIVRATAASLRARFLACEVLFERDFVFTSTVGPGLVAEVYAGALTADLTGRANSWGLLYDHDDPGPVGVRFMMLGEPAIPALRRLLDDDRRLLTYDGSEEATVGNAYHYRVKDFAAYYLSKLVRAPMQLYPDPVDRDRAIATLRQRLP